MDHSEEVSEPIEQQVLSTAGALPATHRDLSCVLIILADLGSHPYAEHLLMDPSTNGILAGRL